MSAIRRCDDCRYYRYCRRQPHGHSQFAIVL